MPMVDDPFENTCVAVDISLGDTSPPRILEEILNPAHGRYS